MPLTQKQIDDRKEYIRRQVVKNKVDTNNPQNVFDWMMDNDDDLTDDSKVQSFLDSEREVEAINQEDQAKVFLESRGYTVSKVVAPLLRE